MTQPFSENNMFYTAIGCCKILQDHIAESIELTKEQQIVCITLIRKMSQESFFFFARHVLEFDLLTEQTHQKWAKDLQSIFGKKERIMRLKPRASFKTTLYGIAFILWVWSCISPKLRIFYTSSNALLLEEVSDKLTQFLAAGNTLFQMVFGLNRDTEGKIPPKNTNDVFNITGRSGKGFSLIMRTAGGSTVGLHPNIIIVDDPCFEGSTPVLTKTGYKPIKDILPGEFVLTSEGHKEVIKSGITARDVPVETYVINGCQLTMTSSHKVITKERGKVPVSQLNSNDTIIKYQGDSWKYEKLVLQKLSSSTGLFIDVIQKANTGHTGNILNQVEVLIQKIEVCTFLFGDFIKGIFQRVFMFIIKMEIMMIIQLKIWNVLKGGRIILSIPRKRAKESKIWIIWQESESRLMIGSVLQKGEKYLVIGLKKCLGKHQKLKKIVCSVVKNTKEEISVKQDKNFVQNPVEENTDGDRKRRIDVYNLTVKDCHEYVANGVLVANCSVEDRESAVIRSKKERWFDSLNPLLVPFVQDGLDYSCLLFIATRWHRNDLMDHIFQLLAKNKKEKEKWDIEIESIYNSDKKSNYPEFVSDEKIESIKSAISNVFFSCNTGEAPVLMADFTIKEIKDVAIGDKIIGFTLADGMQNKSKLIITEVLNKKSKMAAVVKITLESGRVIRCTPDHKWYNGRSGKDPGHSPYTPAKVGHYLLRVVDCHYKPSYEDLLNWRYLGGLLDGEGSLKYSQLSLHQSQKHNPGVYSKMIEVMSSLGITYNIYAHKGKEGCHQFHIRGGRDTRAYLIRYGNMGKKEQLLDGILTDRNRTVFQDQSKQCKDHDPKIIVQGGRDSIVSIEPDGDEMVYSMQTTTGNYVVWGYASKNCQYENNPMSESVRIFDEKKFHYVRPGQIDVTRGQIACFFDPSQGKSNSDWPAVIWTHYENKLITIIDAFDKEKVELATLIPLIANRNQILGTAVMVYEDNGVSLIGDSLKRAHDNIGYPVYLEPKRNSSNKDERILSIQPFLYTGLCRFFEDWETRYPELMDQLMFYAPGGQGGQYDDFPDVIELAISYYRRSNFEFVRYEGIL